MCVANTTHKISFATQFPVNHLAYNGAFDSIVTAAGAEVKTFSAETGTIRGSFSVPTATPAGEWRDTWLC